jgi:hypothetical protein
MVPMNKRMLFAGGGVLAFAVLAAGCGGYNNNYGPTYCGNPSHIVLIYPAPGASAIPSTIGAVYVAAPIGLGGSTSYGATIVGPGGGSENTNTFTSVQQSAIPTPAATPSFSNPHYYQATLTAPLAPATEFEVYFNDTANFCQPNVALGGFTTQ